VNHHSSVGRERQGLHGGYNSHKRPTKTFFIDISVSFKHILVRQYQARPIGALMSKIGGRNDQTHARQPQSDRETTRSGITPASAAL
jgi:hypothetical protein